MSRLLYTFYRLVGMARRRPLPLSTVVILAVGGILALPVGASAEAVVGAENTQGHPGLPDGRVYEEVSPANKYGNQTRTGTESFPLAFVAPDGQSVLYGGSGALAEKSTNGLINSLYVSQRTGSGWATRSAMPLPSVGVNSVEENVQFTDMPTWIVPSEDVSHLLFGTFGSLPYVGAPDTAGLTNNIYLEGPDPFAEPTWVGRSQIEGAPGGLGSNSFSAMEVAGVSPDLKTIYFSYEGTLFPGASGLYEYREGVLSDAGALPGGETSTGGAIPAAQGGGIKMISPAALDNQVSSDGSRIFFTRTDKTGTLELYVRVTEGDGTKHTVLVSQSQLPGHAGEPAPGGAWAMPSTQWIANGVGYPEHRNGQEPPSYVFASPDGSHAFFQSTDRLTETAPEGSAVKTYDFAVDTDRLEYIPGLTGSIVSVDGNGSSLMFENTATSPFELDRWVSGPGGGSIADIAQLPSVAGNVCGVVLCVGSAYTTSDGSVTVFSAESPIPGFNDGGTHYELGNENEEPETFAGLIPNQEIFRYDASSNKLDCISCPPTGLTPSSNAIDSLNAFEGNDPTDSGGQLSVSAGRAMSADGQRVFFETRDALVPQDVNGTSDVYQWENGTVYLISSGHSPNRSVFTGISESGNDVFFNTAEGIKSGDRDQGYDIYDARVPRPGDQPPAEALPCSGDACQGPPSVPQLLAPPVSEEFNGAGNLTPAPTSRSAVKSLTLAQRLTRALKVCTREKSARKRKLCKLQAQRRYKAKAIHARAGRQARHHNGRNN